jgi:dienelactone hydrolase
MKVQSIGHGIRMVASRAIDMAVLARLSGIEVLKPPVIDFTPVDPVGFWKASRVLTPYPVQVVDEWMPLEGRAWRSVELAGESSGPGTHPGSTRLMASSHIHRNPDPALPVVILVHGYAIPFTGFDRWLAWRIRRRGASTIRIDLPYHLRRTPPGRDSGDGFFSIDPAHTRAVVQQSVEDVAALVAWARSEVSPLVSVVGTSLGGLITVLLAALVDLDGVVAVAPLCDPPASFTMRPPGALQRRLGMLGEGDSYWGRDRRVAKEFLDLALAPLVARNLEPVTAGERITLVKADNDLIVGPGPIDELAAAWGTDLWRYPQGHITVMNAPGVARRIVDRVVDVHPRGDVMRLAG